MKYKDNYKKLIIDVLDFYAKDIASDAPVEANDLIVKVVDKYLSNIADRDAYIIRQFYGLDDGQHHTLAEIGDAVGLTREGVKHVRGRILSKFNSSTYGKYIRLVCDIPESDDNLFVLMDRIIILEQAYKNVKKALQTLRLDYNNALTFIQNILDASKESFENSCKKIDNSKYHDILLEDTQLSGRAINALHRYGINNVEELLNLNSVELERIPGLGIKTYQEIATMCNTVYGAKFELYESLNQCEFTNMKKTKE